MCSWNQWIHLHQKSCINIHWKLVFGFWVAVSRLEPDLHPHGGCGWCHNGWWHHNGWWRHNGGNHGDGDDAGNHGDGGDGGNHGDDDVTSSIWHAKLPLEGEEEMRWRWWRHNGWSYVGVGWLYGDDVTMVGYMSVLGGYMVMMSHRQAHTIQAAMPDLQGSQLSGTPLPGRPIKNLHSIQSTQVCCRGLLCVPKTCTKTFGERSFTSAAPYIIMPYPSK